MNCVGEKLWLSDTVNIYFIFHLSQDKSDSLQMIIMAQKQVSPVLWWLQHFSENTQSGPFLHLLKLNFRILFSDFLIISQNQCSMKNIKSACCSQWYYCRNIIISCSSSAVVTTKIWFCRLKQSEVLNVWFSERGWWHVSGMFFSAITFCVCLSITFIELLCRPLQK